MNRVKMIAICFVLMSVLAGCGSKFGKTGQVKENKRYQAFQELNKGNWDKSVELFSHYPAKNRQDYMGLIKAQIGAQKYEEALKTIEEAKGEFERNKEFMYYEARIDMLQGNETAAAECYYLLLDQDGTNTELIKRLSDLLWKNGDYNKIIDMDLKIIHEDMKNNSCITELLKAYAMLEDSDRAEEIYEKMSEHKYVDLVKAFIEGYEELKKENLDEAKETVFQEAVLKMAKEFDGIYIGKVDARLNPHGQGIGSWRIANNQVGIYMGEYAEGKPNGQGIAYRESHSQRTDSKGREKESCHRELYEAEWIDGIPSGLLKETEYFDTYIDGKIGYKHEYVKEIFMENGVGQGTAKIISRYYEDGGWRSPETKEYFLVDGVPGLFEFEGERIYGKYSHDKYVSKDKEPRDYKYLWDEWEN